jgi:hypothetical protein
LVHLRVIAVAIGRKGTEIWAKQADLQPVHCKSDRLLGKVRMSCKVLLPPLLFSFEATTMLTQGGFVGAKILIASNSLNIILV